ncbi:MAG TPA: type II toxin-antitoxin system RelE/ParE family toxin [Xanthobacteraceae bacterium]|jgi:plasmid stabilization system protein ParE
MTRVVYATKAKRDVIRIVERIAVEDPNAATKFARRIEHHCSLLATSPAMGRKRPDVGIAVRSLVQGSYLVFYRWSIEDDLVEILHVRHGKRRLPQLRD